jgi:predicted metal-dependent phosphoesterase TrpH
LTKLVKADLHLHTCYSMDCAMTLEQVIDRCVEIGINCLAITDHDTIDGALRLKEVAPFTVIVGEEILTTGGEVIGLFLTHRVPSGLSPEETISRIKSQGGLVCIPHPYDTLRLSASRDSLFESLMPHIDIVEVFNARSLSPSSTDKAWQLARKYGKPASAGSDAHSPQEIGNACVEMPPFNDKHSFIASLEQGKITGKRSSPAVHFHSTWARLKKKLF